MEAADFWNDPEASQKKMKELKSMKDDVATYASLTTQFEDIETLCRQRSICGNICFFDDTV